MLGTIRRLSIVMTISSKLRGIARVIQCKPQGDGDGAVVSRSIGSHQLDYFDPFLLLDVFTLKFPAGFPDHPHRGFETVTYILPTEGNGSVWHEDFAGHSGVIGPGDLQWMTAGRGIVHAEIPKDDHTPIKGLQLWVNLPAASKMMEPRYQELTKDKIPVYVRKDDGVTCRVIAGSAMGIKSAVYTRTEAHYAHFTLPVGSQEVEHHIDSGLNSFIYIIEGECAIKTSGTASSNSGSGSKAESSSPKQGSGSPKTGSGSPKTGSDMPKAGSESPKAAGPGSTIVKSSHTILLDATGDSVRFQQSGSQPCELVVISGRPLKEPMERRGPFVMNTRQEIDQAISDFQNGTNGFENAVGWKSKAGIEFNKRRGHA